MGERLPSNLFFANPKIYSRRSVCQDLGNIEYLNHVISVFINYISAKNVITFVESSRECRLD